MKRPYSHAGQIQSENFEIEDVSSQIEENVKSEKPEDELETIVPFEETPISNAAETESQTPNKEKTKFSLKGLLNKSNVKIVTSIKIFKCGICNQEWVTKGFFKIKTSTWTEYVFGWMSHPTYVISLLIKAK